MNEIFTSIKRTPTNIRFISNSFLYAFSCGLSFGMTTFFNGILSYVETKPQVTVYFESETKESNWIYTTATNRLG